MFRSSAAMASGAVALLFTISACAGHTGFVPPGATGAGMQRANLLAPAATARTRVRFRIAVPGRTRTSAPHRIFPAYVSASTEKASFVVQGQNESKPEAAQVFACTNVCTGLVNAPVGVDRITLTLKDKRGRSLSRGDTSVLLFQKNNNTLDFTLDGVVSKVRLVAVPASLPVVPASQGSVLFEARDADGNIIMPDGHYVDASGKPLTFDVSSGSAALTFATKVVSAPGAPIPFSYNGSLHVGTLTLTPSAHAGTTTTARFSPATITLIPGIAKRLSPPVPIAATGATQVPFSFSDNYSFIFGSWRGAGYVGRLDDTTGLYSTWDAFSGPFVMPPVDTGGGYSSYVPEADGTFDAIGPTGQQFHQSNTCPAYKTFEPVGNNGSIYFCSSSVVTGALDGYALTGGSSFASQTWEVYGDDRKIQVIGGNAYVITTQGLYQYGVESAISGATAVGTNITSTSTAYLGFADGSVKSGGIKRASFSHAVQSVIGIGTSIYAAEDERVFGVKNASGRFETAGLPIGNVVEITTGFNNAPVLVESDGTLDVMGV